MTMANKKKEAPAAAQIIDGKAVAKKLRESIKRHVDVLIEDHKILPGLAVVLVGDDPASAIYVSNKEKAAKEVGMRGFVHRLPQNTSQDELLKIVAQLNEDLKVNGILVQMPLPKQIDSATVLKLIDPAKDVDGLHIENMGRLMADLPGLVPCTPMGCVVLAKTVQQNLTGLHAVIIGRSHLV
jgi:methylenetetrahydrofolate dehydrogenase (NADP+)/methenyltetrahydrofolate cyclohydrolase